MMKTPVAGDITPDNTVLSGVMSRQVTVEAERLPPENANGLPARGRGGTNHRYLGSNPVAARIECPNMPDVTLPLPMFPTQRPLPG
jgi:hypothetical protein